MLVLHILKLHIFYNYNVLYDYVGVYRIQSDPWIGGLDWIENLKIGNRWIGYGFHYVNLQKSVNPQKYVNLQKSFYLIKKLIKKFLNVTLHSYTSTLTYLSYYPIIVKNKK